MGIGTLRRNYEPAGATNPPQALKNAENAPKSVLKGADGVLSQKATKHTAKKNNPPRQRGATA